MSFIFSFLPVSAAQSNQVSHSALASSPFMPARRQIGERANFHCVVRVSQCASKLPLSDKKSGGVKAPEICFLSTRHLP